MPPSSPSPRTFCRARDDYAARRIKGLFGVPPSDRMTYRYPSDLIRPACPRDGRVCPSLPFLINGATTIQAQSNDCTTCPSGSQWLAEWRQHRRWLHMPPAIRWHPANVPKYRIVLLCVEYPPHPPDDQVVFGCRTASNNTIQGHS